jgi:hypothetical protein
MQPSAPNRRLCFVVGNMSGNGRIIQKLTADCFHDADMEAALGLSQF